VRRRCVSLLASQGQVNIEIVIVVATVAAVVGDNVGYVIGRTGGRRLLERPGLLEHHRRMIIVKGEPFFEKHGPKAVFLVRWVAGLRTAAAWLAGIKPHALADVPVLERARRGLLGDRHRTARLLPWLAGGGDLQGRRDCRRGRRGARRRRIHAVAPAAQSAC
jgi:hypothetical protein